MVVMRDILLGLLVLALLFGAVQSCRLSKANEASDEQNRQLVQCRSEGLALVRSLALVDEQAAANIAEAETRAAAAREAVVRAEQAEQEAAARQAAATKALRDAMRDPTCAEQLEVTLCPAIPLL